MKFKALGLAGIAIAMYTIPAFAHHSFAMFDADKKMTLEGTIKEFNWTNPHTWIYLTTVDAASGKQVEWALEGGGPATLARRGWSKNTFKAGDKVQAIVYPIKDGSRGGLLGIVNRDGEQFDGD